MITNDSFDTALTSAHFFKDPYPLYHQLRAEAPVYWCEAWGAWVLTRYADVMAVLRDADRFSSAGRVGYLLQQLPAPARQQVTALERHYTIGLAHTDPPDHTRLRGLLNKVFTPRMVAAWRGRVQQVVDELVDQVVEHRHMDLISDLAYPLPATIIAEMIGAPQGDIGLFRDWAVAINRLFEKGGRIEEAAAHAAQDSLYEMREYTVKLAAIKRNAPADDILSRLVAADDADKLTVDEMVSTCVTLFVAGHETTTNLIGNGMLALLQHPDQMAVLRAEPALIDNAVEEMLRYDPSVPRGWRIAKAAVEIGGQTINKGALVFPILAAANRDPAQFPDPDRFDVRREGTKHIAFGYGIHFCLGAPLARLEGAVAVNRLLERLPNLRLDADQLTWRHDVAIRSLERLPVAF